MDFATRKYSESVSPMTSPPTSSSHSGFPISIIAIIGILATVFLLVTYYVFVIKCCLNWHIVDFLRPFSFSRRRRRVEDNQFMVYSTAVENRGLDKSIIRSIPIFQYNKTENCECAVCLNEFQEDEKLKVIPNCAHIFHIDCIDIWLQNSQNCPLCRISVSSSSIATKFRPQDQDPHRSSDNSADEEYVVIEITERLNSGHFSITPSPRKIEQNVTRKKLRKLSHVLSMGDEYIDMRNKDEQFTIQPIRRSFSMDSAADRQLYVAVQEIIKQQKQVPDVSSSEGTSGRVRRSFFSFGRGSRNAVLPVLLEPQ